jgi:hypothetical protein
MLGHEMKEELEALRDALPTMTERSREFAESLLMQAAERGLSEKQLFWVKKLIEPKPAAASVDIGNFRGVIDLFNTASKNLKHPKVRLQLPDGKPIALAIAGPASKYPGTVNVTDGKKFGENVWYGRVDTKGKWELSSKVDTQTAVSLTALLVNFAANPAKVASLYGKQTGSCCFCARDLTDERSVSVGYGPQCASKYNLPWGN